MAAKRLLLALPSHVTVEDAEAALAERLGYARDAAETVTHRYLDTFDWRAHAAGAVIEAVSTGRETRLRWRAADTGRDVLDSTLEALPAFAWDLPKGALRERLAPVIEMRALIAMTRTRMRRTRGRILDALGKTVVWLDFSEPRSGANTVQLLPVRGYDKPLARALGVLRDRVGCRRVRPDPMIAATSGLERPPGDYGSRHSVHLAPDERADDACKRILAELASVVTENEDGVVRDVDSEFLHDYRVAMRRTRSLLTQVKGVFPPSRMAPFSRGFRWLSDMTGPPRDMDVYLLGFPAFEAAVPEQLRGDLGVLREELLIAKSEVHGALAKALGSARYKKLMDAWRSFVSSPSPLRPTSPNAARPVVDVARERTWRLYRRAINEGRAIDDDTPAEAVHELRKTCKKLRYVIEFFRSLFPEKDVRFALRVLKRLQDVLGRFQDYEVQQTELGALRARIDARGALTPASERAIDALVEELAKGQRNARAEFARRFAEFDTKGHRRAYRRLYRKRPRQKAGS